MEKKKNSVGDSHLASDIASSTPVYSTFVAAVFPPGAESGRLVAGKPSRLMRCQARQRGVSPLWSIQCSTFSTQTSQLYSLNSHIWALSFSNTACVTMHGLTQLINMRNCWIRVLKYTSEVQKYSVECNVETVVFTSEKLKHNNVWLSYSKITKF